MVESEKKNVTELLQDYIQNIHKNLARIGSNSTIKIREKSLKMLKITLPVWEDNEKLYNLRLSDFVDEITEEGIHLFENNENAQEYIGRKVTSKNLYDTVAVSYTHLGRSPYIYNKILQCQIEQESHGQILPGYRIVYCFLQKGFLRTIFHMFQSDFAGQQRHQKRYP